MDDDELPADWQRDERYDRLSRRSDRERTYEGYVHESGDVRLHVAFPAAETGDSGAYTVFVTLYPYTELSESDEVRTVSTRTRAEEVVLSFAKLFDGACDSEGNVENAVQYALERTRPADVADTSLINER